MSKQDGGPAFPSTVENQTDTTFIATSARIDPNTTHYFLGLSVRDYFAGQALAGLLANRDFTWPTLQQAPLAQAVYEVADAMLAARDKP